MLKKFVLLFACVLLLLIATLIWGLLGPIPEALAAGNWLSDLQQAGRTLTINDWTAHLPLLVMVIIMTLVVDGIVIGVVIRKRRQSRDIAHPYEEI